MTEKRGREEESWKKREMFKQLQKTYNSKRLKLLEPRI